MSKKRKFYTPAYRREAAHLVIDTGHPIADVAREIGVGEQLLGRSVALERKLETIARHRRWTSTSGPSWNGCGPRSPAGWTWSS